MVSLPIAVSIGLFLNTGATLVKPLRNDVYEYTAAVCDFSPFFLVFEVWIMIMGFSTVGLTAGYYYYIRKYRVPRIFYSWQSGLSEIFWSTTALIAFVVHYVMAKYYWRDDEALIWGNCMIFTGFCVFFMVSTIYHIQAVVLVGTVGNKGVNSIAPGKDDVTESRKNAKSATMDKGNSGVKGVSTGVGGGKSDTAGLVSIKAKKKKDSALDMFVDDVTENAMGTVEKVLESTLALEKQTLRWYVHIVTEHSKKFKSLSIKSKVLTKRIFDDLFNLFVLEKLIEAHHFRSVWLLYELCLKCEDSEDLIDKAWEAETLPRVSERDFIGVEQRRKELNSYVLIDNKAIRLHLENYDGAVQDDVDLPDAEKKGDKKMVPSYAVVSRENFAEVKKMASGGNDGNMISKKFSLNVLADKSHADRSVEKIEEKGHTHSSSHTENTVGGDNPESGSRGRSPSKKG